MAQFTLSVPKLVKARKAGHEKLKVERERRAERIRAFTGPDYGDVATKKSRKHYLNLIHQAARTLAAYLVPRDPRATVNAKKLEGIAESTALEYSLTGWSQETELKKLMRRIVMEALVSPMAIVRFGLKANGDVYKSEDREVDLGMPFAELVDFDDYVLDPGCTRRDTALFEAVRIVTPREYALALPVFDENARKIIESLPSLDEESKGDERQGRISPTDPDDYELTDQIELWEHFVYTNDNVFVVTLPAGRDREEEVLSNEPYQGALRGPLEALYFETVPGDNPMPLAPLAPLMKLSEAADEVFAKTVNHLKKSKTIFAFNRQAEEDGETIQNGKDMGGVAVDDVDAMKTIELSGVNAGLRDGVNYMDDKWNTASGNLHTVGGQSDPRKTATAATQDNANAGISLSDMQATTQEFTSRIFRRVGFYYATDPLMRWYGLRRIRGGHMIPVEYTPEQRESDPFDHDIRVDATSMEPQDANLKMRRLNEFFQTMPAVLQLPMIDPIKYMRLFARKFDEPELEEIVIPQVQMAMQAAGPPGSPPVPGGLPKGPNPPQGQAGGPRPNPGERPVDMQRSAMAAGVPGQ